MMKIKKPWRILVFPAGMEGGVEIWRSLSPCKEVELFAASSAVSNHSSYIYPRVNLVPDVRQGDGWLLTINALIENLGIDFILPVNDDIIEALNNRRDEIACPLLLPPSRAVVTARSKTLTKKMLRDVVPVVRAPGEEGAPLFPRIIKPDAAYGEKNLLTIHKAEDMPRDVEESQIIEECLPGREFTVDCFTDRHGAVRFCSARVRVRVRMGTSMNALLAEAEKQALFKEWAQKISDKTGMRGMWFFQAKEDASGEARLTEVDTRIAGTAGLNRVRGANLPLLAIYDAAGMDIEIALLDDDTVELDRAFVNRYSHNIKYDTVYVDWDDTIVVHGKLNLHIVRFLYQCAERGVRIVLITQSLSPDLQADIAARRLSELFDEIIHLPETVGKETRINPAGAIFIDDSFSHRQKVAAAHGIPCFSPDMVDLLQDERLGGERAG